jgi:hypothetical protein
MAKMAKVASKMMSHRLNRMPSEFGGMIDQNQNCSWVQQLSGTSELEEDLGASRGEDQIRAANILACASRHPFPSRHMETPAHDIRHYTDP